MAGLTHAQQLELLVPPVRAPRPLSGPGDPGTRVASIPPVSPPKAAQRGTATTTSPSAPPRVLQSRHTFLGELFDMLSKRPKDDATISWSSDGKSMVIKKVDAFEKDVLPVFFPSQKKRTFFRTLQRFSFKRLTDKHGAVSFTHADLNDRSTRAEFLAVPPKLDPPRKERGKAGDSDSEKKGEVTPPSSATSAASANPATANTGPAPMTAAQFTPSPTPATPTTTASSGEASTVGIPRSHPTPPPFDKANQIPLTSMYCASCHQLPPRWTEYHYPDVGGVVRCGYCGQGYYLNSTPTPARLPILMGPAAPRQAQVLPAKRKREDDSDSETESSKRSRQDTNSDGPPSRSTSPSTTSESTTVSMSTIRPITAPSAPCGSPQTAPPSAEDSDEEMADVVKLTTDSAASSTAERSPAASYAHASRVADENTSTSPGEEQMTVPAPDPSSPHPQSADHAPAETQHASAQPLPTPMPTPPALPPPPPVCAACRIAGKGMGRYVISGRECSFCDRGSARAGPAAVPAVAGGKGKERAYGETSATSPPRKSTKGALSLKRILADDPHEGMPPPAALPVRLRAV
ncbi:C2H2-type domain-containing protein [Mycena indigotica]|uniref:C2H2-type domain-containing protein n=1 Tax=Mycena indigotica TaxID=2126181 RepID=A0A8H6S2W6_9AGAR|nr:C2H2-type domain-containing protein [Mycena indigotica]KAF7291338.1 C2H2-type domain-containing protein [Mycena indigotica]